LSTDKKLGHYPPAPKESFKGDLYMRVERQVIYGLPETNSSIFIIRSYIYDCNSLNKREREQLSSATKSMSKESLEYKGFTEIKNDILKYLES